MDIESSYNSGDYTICQSTLDLSPLSPNLHAKRETRKGKETKIINRSKTLTCLTEETIRILKQSKNKCININDLARMCNVPKRRVYDVVNILQGIDKIRRLKTNIIEYIEEQNIPLQQQYQQLKLQLFQLTKHEQKLDIANEFFKSKLVQLNNTLIKQQNNSVLSCDQNSKICFKHFSQEQTQIQQLGNPSEHIHIKFNSFVDSLWSFEQNIIEQQFNFEGQIY